MTGKVEAAKKEHAEAEAADKVYQERLAETRRAAETFHNELREAHDAARADVSAIAY